MQQPFPNSDVASRSDLRFRCGSLVYTKAGLLTLFGWLLWGDFVFTLMEAVMPSLLPLILKGHGASNREIVVIVSMIYMVINSALNPVISYQSDRFRSRWGRRRPFIFVTTPLVVLFLIGVPFAPEILFALRSALPLDGLLARSPVAPIILIFGVLVVGFQIFNMFVSSVYYYLIPDVVPLEFTGRFYGLFRLFGTLASMTFNFFIFGLAETHLRSIFVIIALTYGLFIMLMCWRVKEGEYPPVVREEDDHWWRGIQNYLRECYGSSYYWWVFLAYSALGWGAAGDVFAVFFYRDELGISLDLLGKTTAAAGLTFALLSYFFGILMDRIGCHKMLILSLACTICSSLIMYFFAVNKVTGVTCILIRFIPLGLCSLALAKWTIDVYPRARYGQFASAGALFASIGSLIAAPIYATILDLTNVYRNFLLWHSAFAIIAIVAAIVVYRQSSSMEKGEANLHK